MKYQLVLNFTKFCTLNQLNYFITFNSTIGFVIVKFIFYKSLMSGATHARFTLGVSGSPPNTISLYSLIHTLKHP